MELPSRTLKRASIALLVGLLMTTAGCAGLSGGDGGTTTADSVTTETTEMAETTTSTSETTTQSESTDSDGHSHTHDDESTSDASDGDAAYTGEMAVMVAGDRVDLAESLDGDAAIEMNDMDSWHANESVTLSNALSSAGVEADTSTLTYDGETYDASADGTNVVYRVDGNEVDPTEYMLESGDEVWVLVVTEDSNVSTPGEYIPPEQLHVHGDIEFTVDGEQLDFSRDKYQQAGHNDHFHFEGGHSNPWHAHSAHVTLGYGVSTLDGIDVTEDAITYNGTTYPFDGENGSVTVMVNGESVDPNEYYLKDGDSVTIEIESDN